MGLLSMMLERKYQLEDREQVSQGVDSLLGSPALKMDIGSDFNTGEIKPGSGLMANINDPQAQMEFAGGLMKLPGMEGIGSQMMSNQRTRQSTEGMSARNLDQTRINNNMQANDRQLSREQNQNQFDTSLAVNQDQFNQTQQMRFMEIMQDPGMTMTDKMKVLGEQEENQEFFTAYHNANDLSALLKEMGSETFNTSDKNYAARMGIMGNRVMMDYAKLAGMGVLQQGEIEMIEDILPDPTSWDGNWSWDTSMAASYEKIARLFDAKYQARVHRQGKLGIPSGDMMMPIPPPGQ